MQTIPEDAKEVLLPSPHLNVVDLTHFILPKLNAACSLTKMDDATLFSKVASLVQGGQGITVFFSIDLPPSEEIMALQGRAENMSRQGYQSLAYPLKGGVLRLPFWIFSYWRKVHEATEAKRKWIPAIEWLRSKKLHSMITFLATVPWDYKLPKDIFADITDLTSLCSEQWLSSSHANMMAAVGNKSLVDHQVSNKIAASTEFVQKLIQTYRFKRDTYLDDSKNFIHRLSNMLKEDTIQTVGMAVAVRLRSGTVELPTDNQPSNHWVSVVVERDTFTIHYGDSLGREPPDELLKIMEWWLGTIFNQAFVIEKLQSTVQRDGFSCLVMAMNGVMHKLLPQGHSLIPVGEPPVIGRMDLLKSIVSVLKNRVCTTKRLSRTLCLPYNRTF